MQILQHLNCGTSLGFFVVCRSQGNTAVNHLSVSENVKKLTFTCRIGRVRFVMHKDGFAVA